MKASVARGRAPCTAPAAAGPIRRQAPRVAAAAAPDGDATPGLEQQGATRPRQISPTASRRKTGGFGGRAAPPGPPPPSQSRSAASPPAPGATSGSSGGGAWGGPVPPRPAANGSRGARPTAPVRGGTGASSAAPPDLLGALWGALFVAGAPAPQEVAREAATAAAALASKLQRYIEPPPPGARPWKRLRAGQTSSQQLQRQRLPRLGTAPYCPSALRLVR
jgi:hypothetical protein